MMAASTSTSTLHSSPVARIQKFIDQERDLLEFIRNLKNQFWDLLIAAKKFPGLQSTVSIFQKEFSNATLRPRHFLMLQEANTLLTKLKGKSPKEMTKFKREILDLEKEMIDFEKTLTSMNQKIKDLKSQMYALRSTESKSFGKMPTSTPVVEETKTGEATLRTLQILEDNAGKEADSAYLVCKTTTSLKGQQQARQQFRIHARFSRQARRTLTESEASVVRITHTSTQEQLVWLQEMLERESEKCYDDEFNPFLNFPEICDQLIPILLKKIEINPSDKPALLFLEKIYLKKGMYNEALCQREKYLTVLWREAEAIYHAESKEQTFKFDSQPEFENWVAIKNANYVPINTFHSNFYVSRISDSVTLPRDWVTYSDVRNQSSYFDQTKCFELAFQVAGLMTRFVHEPAVSGDYYDTRIRDDKYDRVRIRGKEREFITALGLGGSLHGILVELANSNAELFAFFEYSYIPEKYRAFFRETLFLDPAKPYAKYSPHFYREVGPFVPRGQVLLTGTPASVLPKDVMGIIAQYESEEPVVAHLPLREASYFKSYYETLSKIIKDGIDHLKKELDEKLSEPTKSLVEGLDKERDNAIKVLTSERVLLTSLCDEIDNIGTVGLADEKKCGLLTRDNYIHLILSLKEIIDKVKPAEGMSKELQQTLKNCQNARYLVPSEFYVSNEEKDFSSASSSSSTLKIIEGQPYFQYMIDVIKGEVEACANKSEKRYQVRREKLENFLIQFSTEFESKEACTHGSTQDYQRVARLFTAMQSPAGDLLLALNSHQSYVKGLFSNSDSYSRVQSGFQKLIDVGILPKQEAVLSPAPK